MAPAASIPASLPFVERNGARRGVVGSPSAVGCSGTVLPSEAPMAVAACHEFGAEGFAASVEENAQPFAVVTGHVSQAEAAEVER